MKKTELTKKQQKKFKWLMKANTYDENVEVSKSGYLIWKGGIWEGGIWEGGIWEGGIWEGGIWEDGTWEGGSMWSNLKQRYVKVKWNGKEFEEDLK